MTNRIAFVLALLIVLIFVIDAIFNGGQLPIFLGKKMDALIEYVSIWR